jgi:hypothetical protein
MCGSCKSAIMGRENKCCLFSTRVGLYLITAITITLWFCSLFNFIRVVTRVWDPLTWIGLLIATFRVAACFGLCKDSIRSRNRYFYIMLGSTVFETALVTW